MILGKESLMRVAVISLLGSWLFVVPVAAKEPLGPVTPLDLVTGITSLPAAAFACEDQSFGYRIGAIVPEGTPFVIPTGKVFVLTNVEFVLPNPESVSGDGGHGVLWAISPTTTAPMTIVSLRSSRTSAGAEVALTHGTRIPSGHSLCASDLAGNPLVTTVHGYFTDAGAPGGGRK
jgi:hypothetical protein